MKFYKSFNKKLDKARSILARPLTYAEKVLYTHIASKDIHNYARGEEYVMFKPDRVAMQDATAQMALLQFMNAGKETVAVPSTVHCDHLIKAYEGVGKDLPAALAENDEVYQFLQNAASKYGIGFWKPGAGIIHQILLENYVFPGGMMIGTDSHTPNGGGLAMCSIGVGGADAVDVMSGISWELKMPKIIGVALTGKLNGWASAKDVILKLAGMLTVKGATNCIIEYFGEGAATISCTGKATICNMGAEVGATCSMFPFDDMMYEYLVNTGREKVAIMASKLSLSQDKEVLDHPELYYDKVITIDLSSLEPHVNGPFTPDAACPISAMRNKVMREGYPDDIEVALVGSCTNSSYRDLMSVASILQQMKEKHITPKAKLIINPGSMRISSTLEKEGTMDLFKECGATIMTNACGPCIGQWQRITDDNTRRNTIVTTFNRNFAKRADGNPNTNAFVTTPEMVAAYYISGSLSFNPMTDYIVNDDGKKVMLDAPCSIEFPKEGFSMLEDDGYIAPTNGKADIFISDSSERLQRLMPFPAFNKDNYKGMPVLLKTYGKCTTDHISMAGPWLRYRGHLEHISDNLLMGATNAFTRATNDTLDMISMKRDTVSAVAKHYKLYGVSSIIVAEENYGEGSSREHAAMEPRYLGVHVVLAKSFARIHETNLKKQGILPLTFDNPADYDKILEHDKVSVIGIDKFNESSKLSIHIEHYGGSTEDIPVSHTYNKQQVKWLYAGSALNYIANARK